MAEEIGVVTDDVLEMWSSLVGRDRFGHPPSVVAESVRRTGGVLVEGATEEQIAAVEARLGVSLPFSYRRFLSCSNGAYGNQLGLQPDPPGPGGRPTALLPVDRIGFVTVDDPLAVDAVVQYQAAAPLGQSTLHQPTGGDEVAYLLAPLVGPRSASKRGHGHWSLRIGYTADPATVLLLNPMVMDGLGEWEVVILQPEEEFRYPSFDAWLAAMLERERATQQPPGRSRARLQRTSASNPAAAGAAEHLIDIEPDVAWMADRLNRALAPGVRSLFQDLVLHLLEWIDIEHGTGHFGAAVARLLDDPLHDDVALLARLADSPLSGLPDLDEVAGRRRSGDARRPDRLPTPALEALYRAAPDPMLAGLLERRGRPPFADHDRIRLDRLVPDHPGYFRAATAAEAAATSGDHAASSVVGDGDARITGEGAVPGEGRIIELGRRDDLPAPAVARALVRAGHPEAAVALLEELVVETGDHHLLYTVAEIDTPPAWHVLDRAAGHRDGAVRIVALEAAARTRSPLLALRAGPLLDGTDVENLTALLALEIQPTGEAADALLDVWRRRSHLGALRALARRRDRRVLDDCLLLLADEEPAVRRLGAETLRDLRDPGARDALVATLALAEQDDVVVITAHALAMLAAIDAVPVLIERAGQARDEGVRELLERWAHQLLERPRRN